MPADAASPWYLLLSIAALAISSAIASRRFGTALHGESRGSSGAQLAAVWLAALAGAFVGSKLAFLAAEACAEGTTMATLLGGRSVTGALLGGYAGVEAAKRLVGWTSATGDVFALTVPLSLAIGRVGCIAAGCCQGVACDEAWFTVHDGHGHARWPAAHAELLFNAIFLVWVIVAERCGWQPTQRFHIYLIAYGAFRFFHEFLRDDPRWFGPLGGYHATALALVALGVWRYAARRSQRRDRAPEGAV